MPTSDITAATAAPVIASSGDASPITAGELLRAIEATLPPGTRAYLVGRDHDNAQQRRLSPVPDDCCVLNIERDLLCHLDGEAPSDAFLENVGAYCARRLGERRQGRLRREPLTGWRLNVSDRLDTARVLIRDAMAVGEEWTHAYQLLVQASEQVGRIRESLSDPQGEEQFIAEDLFILQALVNAAGVVHDADVSVSALAAAGVKVLAVVTFMDGERPSLVRLNETEGVC